MNEDMDRLTQLLLAKPVQPSRLSRLTSSSTVRCIIAVAVLMVGLALSGALHAAPTHAEKVAAVKTCKDEHGATWVPVWTAEGVMVCISITKVAGK